MLIEKLKITDHPAIGTVELDFRDDTGEPARTVVIAGQNGVGKTVVLEAIQSAFEQMCYFPGQIDADIVFDGSEEDRVEEHLAQYNNGNRLDLHHKLRITRRSRLSFSISHEKIGRGSAFGVDNGPTGLALRAFLSPANVSFAEASPSAVSADILDRSGLLSSRVTADGVGISQLLVALDAQDSSAIARYARQNRDVNPINAVESQLDRFRSAFSRIFPHKRLCDIRADNGTFNILFEENGVETSIHQLSTGEKQVVYRAGAFIRDAGVLQKALILIDEPELSLSPDWQARVLAFYADSLSVGGCPHPQIICATHSPFIVHSASAGKIIVLERGADGQVGPMSHPMFPGVSSSMAVRAFNLDRFIREVRPGRLIVITEGVTDASIIATAWMKVHPGEAMPFKVEPGTGAAPLQGFLNGPGLPSLAETGKVVGLFDYDQEGFTRWSGVWKDCGEFVGGDAATGLLKRHKHLQAWTMLLPVPPHRSDIAGPQFDGGHKLVIELMFEDDAIPSEMRELKRQIGGGSTTAFTGGKVAFADHVKTLPPKYFEAFRSLFARLGHITAAPNQ